MLEHEIAGPVWLFNLPPGSSMDGILLAMTANNIESLQLSTYDYRLCEDESMESRSSATKTFTLGRSKASKCVRLSSTGPLHKIDDRLEFIVKFVVPCWKRQQ